MVWLWIAFAVVMGIIEAFTMGLTTIWFAGGALVAAILSLVTDSLLAQLLVFAVVTLVLVIFTRPVAVKKLNTRTVKTNVDAVIGTTGTAESDVPMHGTGTVKADGKVWTAVLADGSAEIKAGELVEVTAVSGVKLLVKKKEG